MICPKPHSELMTELGCKLKAWLQRHCRSNLVTCRNNSSHRHIQIQTSLTSTCTHKPCTSTRRYNQPHTHRHVHKHGCARIYRHFSRGIYALGKINTFIHTCRITHATQTHSHSQTYKTPRYTTYTPSR